MENKFTVEEANLINIFTEEDAVFDFGNRAKVIKGFGDAMAHLEDDEMVELSLRTIVKLNDLTEQEFAEMKFIAAE